MRLIDADALYESLREAGMVFALRMVETAPTIAPPPNDPLTLEELREMDEEPVWICDPDGSDGMWSLVDLEYELCRTAKGGIAIFDTYGKTWLACRRKPEEN